MFALPSLKLPGSSCMLRRAALPGPAPLTAAPPAPPGVPSCWLPCSCLSLAWGPSRACSPAVSLVNPAAASLFNPAGPRGDGPLKQLLILTPGACAAARGRGVIPPAPGAYTPPPRLFANDTLPALVTPVPCPTPAAAAAAPAAPLPCPGGAHCGVDATTCCCRCCWCMSEPADTAGDMPLPSPPPAPAAAAAALDAGVLVVPQWPSEALANRDPAGRAAA